MTAPTVPEMKEAPAPTEKGDGVVVPRGLLAEAEGLLWLEGYEATAQLLNDIAAQSAGVAMIAATQQAEESDLALKVYRHLTNYAEACSARRENIEKVRDDAFAALSATQQAVSPPEDQGSSLRDTHRNAADGGSSNEGVG